MHLSGFMHRDVKPSNIYLFPDGTVKLGDFSISRSLKDRDPPSGAEVLTEEEVEKLKQKTLGITTRQYRAPEVMFGSRYYDESIDIWGLGCTIAEFILHQMIFPGTSDIGTLQLIFELIGSPVTFNLFRKISGHKRKSYHIISIMVASNRQASVRYS